MTMAVRDMLSMQRSFDRQMEEHRREKKYTDIVLFAIKNPACTNSSSFSSPEVHVHQSILSTRPKFFNSSSFSSPEVHAHQNILGTRSIFFSKLFDQHPTGKRFFVDGIDPITLELLVSHIYTFSEPQDIVKVDNICNIYAGAKLLQLDDVVEKCKDFFPVYVNNRNCVKIWEFTMMDDLDESRYVLHILYNLTQVSQTCDFLKLSHDKLKRLLDARKRTSNYSPMTCLDGLLCWLQHEESGENRVEDFLELLKISSLLDEIDILDLRRVFQQIKILKNNKTAHAFLARYDPSSSSTLNDFNPMDTDEGTDQKEEDDDSPPKYLALAAGHRRWRKVKEFPSLDDADKFVVNEKKWYFIYEKSSKHETTTTRRYSCKLRKSECKAAIKIVSYKSSKRVILYFDKAKHHVECGNIIKENQIVSTQ